MRREERRTKPRPRGPSSRPDRVDADMLVSWLLGTSPLALLLLASVLTSRTRPFREPSPPERRRLVAVGMAAWSLQLIHFSEELGTGFWRAFPEAMGLDPWGRGAFILFNTAWLALWLVCLRAAPRGARMAEWPLWFLGFALLVNGIAHPVLALARGGYFPGLASAVPAGVGGGLLLRELGSVTRRDPEVPVGRPDTERSP